jgi:predicted ATPase
LIPKLAKLMKIEGNKTLKNVCIQWISMLSPTRMVLEQYCILLKEMALDSPIKTKAITNLQILVDVEVTLGLSYIFPLSIILSNSTNYGMILCVTLWLQ